MPIDWASVNWVYVGVLAVLAFFSTLVGSVLSFNRRLLGAVLSALLFAGLFVVWSYYPHNLPLPTGLGDRTAPAAVAPPPVPPAPAPVPERPANPVTTISPPANQ